MSEFGAKVGVCVATFRRPAGLKRTLESLSRLELDEGRGWDVTVYVVENDLSRSSQHVVDECRELLPWPVRYGVEGDRGYSHVRNHLVGMAVAEGMNYIAFIDDDEVAGNRWLDQLLEQAVRTDAHAVLGPVLSQFEEPVPGWLRVAFSRRRHETGQWVGARDFRTGNVLIRTDALARLEGPFDHEFAATGGEDSDLARRMERSGARFVWANDAVVTESVPASRANPRWVIEKRFRTARTMMLSRRRGVSSPVAGLSLLARTIGVFALGELQVASFPLSGREGAFRGACNLAWGFGNLSGLLSRDSSHR